MKRRLIVRLAAIAVCGLAIAQASAGRAGTSDKVTKEIRQAEQAWLDAMAKKDGAAVKAMLHPNYIGMSPLGTIDTRADYVAGTEKGFGGQMDSVGGLAEINVVTFGEDTAVAYGPMKDGVRQYHDVFVKQSRKWLAAFSQVSMIPKPGPITATPGQTMKPSWGETQDPLVKEIRDLERKWLAAMSNKDGAAVEAILDPEYLAMNPGGKLDNRAAFVSEVNGGMFAPNGPWPSLNGLTEVNVAAFGDTVTAYGRMTDGAHWYSDTFKKKDGKWHAIFTQVAPIPKPSH